MRVLFEMDRKDYQPGGKLFLRPSVRGIFVRAGKVAMVYSQKYDYYKFPGGGMKEGETHRQTLIREVREEVGLCVRTGSIREYGVVYRVQKREDLGGLLLQDNFYYFYEAEEQPGKQNLDPYEAEEGFTLEFVDPRTAIAVNRTHDHGPKNPGMTEREARVLELLLKEHLV